MSVVLLLTLLILTGCAGTCCEDSKTASSAPVDLDAAVLKESVTAFLTETKAPVSSVYETVRADLDGDGRKDALVLFKNPYGYWCDTHGCTMLVMRAGEEEFSLVNSIQPVRAPLSVSKAQTNGWRDLIIRVTGRWGDEARDVAMKFDGTRYPENPAAAPEALYMASSRAVRGFY
ncbi:MAG: hypothetical protein WBK77_09365 [Alphaproteobacteria bacterium]